MNEAVNLAGLSALLIAVGRVLKGTPGFPDRWIPTALSLGGAAVVIGVAGFSVNGLAEGLTAGLAAVGANQVWRQHTQEDEKADTRSDAGPGQPNV